MSLPIERVDPDDLIIFAGQVQGNANMLNAASPHVQLERTEIVRIVRLNADMILRCASYIRYLETRLYPPEKIAAVPAAGPYSSKPPRP